MKVTAVAPSNIAFVKYWGARELERGIPLNRSLSMTLSRCVSRCTVEPLPSPPCDGGTDGGAGVEGAGREPADEVWLADRRGGLREAPPGFAGPVRRHLDRLREEAGRSTRLRIAAWNSFPMAAGLASSASGFAALALAASRVLGLEPGAGELSRLARLSGSGSAARSAMGGYVEWPGSDPEAPASVVAPASHWELCDVMALVDVSPKRVSSREGHRRAPGSPHYARRLELLSARLEAVRAAVLDRNLERLGPLLEEEAVELHLVAMSSRPPIFYWTPGTLEVMAAVRELRSEGTGAWYTMDAGPNVHVICEPADREAVLARLRALPAVRDLISDRVGEGPRLVEEHLL